MLRRQQPPFIAMLTTGWSPVYPCHVSSDAMCTRPISTGPFKFVKYKRNKIIRLVGIITFPSEER